MSSNDDSPLLSVKHLHTVIALIACHATRRRLRVTGLGAGAVYEHASDRVLLALFQTSCYVEHATPISQV